MTNGIENRGDREEGSFQIPVPEKPLPFTGERMTSAVEGQIEFEHFHRYCLARDYCHNLDVLDIACGEGYGSAILAAVAKSVMGVDASLETVIHATEQYERPNLRFKHGDALHLPLAAETIDVVVSFETIEHLREHDAFLSEIKRVLRPGGTLIVSTPDRDVYSPPGSEPNPYHLKELRREDFSRLLTSYFSHTLILNQRPVLGSLIATENTHGIRTYEQRGRNQIEVTNQLSRSPYLVAFASDSHLPSPTTSIFLSRNRVHDIVEDARRALEFRNELNLLKSQNIFDKNQSTPLIRINNSIIQLQEVVLSSIRDVKNLIDERVSRETELMEQINRNELEIISKKLLDLEHVIRNEIASRSEKRDLSREIALVNQDLQNLKHEIKTDNERKWSGSIRQDFSEISTALGPILGSTRSQLLKFQEPEESQNFLRGVAEATAKMCGEIKSLSERIKLKADIETKNASHRISEAKAHIAQSHESLEIQKKELDTLRASIDALELRAREHRNAAERHAVAAIKYRNSLVNVIAMSHAIQGNLTHVGFTPRHIAKWFPKAFWQLENLNQKKSALQLQGEQLSSRSADELWDKILSELLTRLNASEDHLVVKDWGKRHTKRNTGVNVQPDGSSAIWIETASSILNREFTVTFGNKPPLSVHNDRETLLTSAVPDEVIQTTGFYPIFLHDEVGAQYYVGTFQVLESEDSCCDLDYLLEKIISEADSHIEKPIAKNDATQAQPKLDTEQNQIIEVNDGPDQGDQRSTGIIARISEGLNSIRNVISAPKGKNDKRSVDVVLREIRDQVILFPFHETPKVSVVIPAYRGLDDLLNCLRSIASTIPTEPSFEIILIDDCPEEPVLDHVPSSDGITTIKNSENLGFLLSCNKAAQMARGEYICFLNTDTVVTENWLSAQLDALRDTPNAALVGGMLLNKDGSIQDAGWRILSNGWGYPLGRNENAHDGRYTHRRFVDCVTGACFCISRANWVRLGGFDEAYTPAFYEEFDLAFRAKRIGLRTVYEPGSKVFHLGSSSYGAERRDELSGRNQKTFVARFGSLLQRQPKGDVEESLLLHANPDLPSILVIDDQIPDPTRHAGALTISSYIQLLRKIGWRVTYAPFDGITDCQNSKFLESLGIELVRKPVSIKGWLEINGKNLEYVWVNRPDIASEVVPIIRKTTAAKIVYYTHDLHHLRLQREAEVTNNSALHKRAEEVFATERIIIQNVDKVISPSLDEAALIKSLLHTAIVDAIPPYFYSKSEIFARSKEAIEQTSDILFVGGFPHTPNVDAALFLVNEVMPLIWNVRPEVKLLLVGYNPPPEILELANSRVLVTGQVPDLAPWMSRARFMLAPLRYGAGVKGKIVEAMRFGLPVVTTPIGAEGLDIDPGRHALIGSDASQMAHAALSLLTDATLCESLSLAGAQLIGNTLSRDAAVSCINKVFEVTRCRVCGSTRLPPEKPADNFRESFVCLDCYSLARTEAVASVLASHLTSDEGTPLSEIKSNLEKYKIHEFGFVGAIPEVLRGYRSYSVSEYFPNIAPGELGPFDVRCEDLTRLTFADNSFDILISQDVLEHVPDPLQAFIETSRVLKPGGVHIFTIPYSEGLQFSVTRARLGANGLVEHLLPEVYHGDPIRKEGALVFTDFGRDLAQMLEGAGLDLTIHNVKLRSSYPYNLKVFEAKKTI